MPRFNENYRNKHAWGGQLARQSQSYDDSVGEAFETERTYQF